MSVPSEAAPARAATWRFRIHDATLEGLKWIAVLAMVLDHTNKYLLDRGHEWMFAVGRMAFPLFALVLAYKLSLAKDRAGAAWRATQRLAVIGLVSSAPFIAAGHIAYSWWWPLNVMFTLAAGTAMVALAEQQRPWAAFLVFTLTGWLAEFFWPGALLLLCAHQLFTRASEIWVALSVVALGGLTLINGSNWAIGGVILFLAASTVSPTIEVPRLKWFFYAFYPMHFVLIATVQQVMLLLPG